MEKQLKIIHLALLSILLSACQSIPQKYAADSALEVLKINEQTAWQGQKSSTQFNNQGWLTNLNDERLNEYIQIALKNNFDIKNSEARLAAQLRQIRISASSLWPSINFNLQENRAETELDNQQIATSSSYNGNLSIAWEIDLWQKLSAQKKAVARTAQASAEDFQAARLSLAATVARTWFNINELKLRLNIEEERLATIKETLEIVEEQYTSGQQSALNVYLNRSDHISQQARVLELRNTLESSIRSFKVLLGEYPNIDLDFSASLPSITESIPAGLPAELVIRRPDVKADLYKWQSAAYDASAAQRARLPSFSLTASYGASSDELKTLDEKTLLWNLINNLSLPLFKGGQLQAQAEAARFLKDANFNNYLSTLLTSFNEVETALSTEKTLFDRAKLIEQAESLAADGYKLALDQYRSGIITYTNLLDSQRRWFDARSQLVILRNSILQNRIALNLALGGDFSTTPIKN